MAADDAAPMAPEAFKAWRLAKGWTRVQAGAALGLGERVIGGYERGEFPIPLAVELAAAALRMDLRRYPASWTLLDHRGVIAQDGASLPTPLWTAPA